MTDDCSPVVPTDEEKKTSSWNFDDLQQDHDEESINSNDFFSELKKNITKNVYFDEQINNSNGLLKPNTQFTTKRFDSSDLISRCKQFLPVITDANKNLFSKIKSGENVRIELDSDDDNEQEKTIEMNLMFYANTDSSSSSSSSSSSDSEHDEQVPLSSLKINNSINNNNNNNKQVNIVEIDSMNKSEEDNVSN